MEGAFLYASILAMVYMLSITIGKRLSSIDDISYRLILGIISIELLVNWLFDTDYIRSFPHLLRINSPLEFLLAPSFYLFIRSKLGRQNRLGKMDIFHFIPAILFFFYLIPFYILPSPEKIELYNQYLLGVKIDPFPSALIYRVLQLVYALAITISVIINRKKSNTFIMVMVVAFLALWFIDLWRFLYGWRGSVIYDNIHQITFLLLLIFFEIRTDSRKGGKKYETSGMNIKKAKELAIKAKQLIEEEQLYKNPKLSLNDIAKSLDVHHNYVSQAFNYNFRKSFKDFVNSMRLEEAKKLLSKVEYNHLTLEAIAEMAGFNSISSFNSNFKKVLGETPSAFKKQAQKSGNH